MMIVAVASVRDQEQAFPNSSVSHGGLTYEPDTREYANPIVESIGERDADSGTISHETGA